MFRRRFLGDIGVPESPPCLNTKSNRFVVASITLGAVPRAGAVGALHGRGDGGAGHDLEGSPVDARRRGRDYTPDLLGGQEISGTQRFVDQAAPRLRRARRAGGRAPRADVGRSGAVPVSNSAGDATCARGGTEVPHDDERGRGRAATHGGRRARSDVAHDLGEERRRRRGPSSTAEASGRRTATTSG